MQLIISASDYRSLPEEQKKLYKVHETEGYYDYPSKYINIAMERDTARNHMFSGDIIDSRDYYQYLTEDEKKLYKVHETFHYPGGSAPIKYKRI